MAHLVLDHWCECDFGEREIAVDEVSLETLVQSLGRWRSWCKEFLPGGEHDTMSHKPILGLRETVLLLHEKLNKEA